MQSPEFRFRDQRTASDVLRPMITAALRFGGLQTPFLPALIDTGSDLCMFDDQLLSLIGLNAYQMGFASTATGIGGVEEVFVVPVEIVLPDLQAASWTIHARCKRMPGSVPGVLGHAGFLGRMKSTFSHARTFELSEIKH